MNDRRLGTCPSVVPQPIHHSSPNATAPFLAQSVTFHFFPFHLYANLVLVGAGLPGGLAKRPSVETAMPGRLPKVVCCGGGLAG